MADLEAFAAIVVREITAAMAPIRERLAVFEAKAARVDENLRELQLLRDRMFAMETKSAQPVHQAVDLSPLTQDIVALRERMAAGEVRPRVDAIDHLVTEMRDRLVTLETKAAQPVTAATVDLAPVTQDIVALRERMAAVEVRQLIPGPPGKDGLNGKDGVPGKDGEPGKDGLAGLSFEGVYQEGQQYEKGNLVTWAGSSWHCNEHTNSKPGDGSKAWTLMVKRGRDGKDGRDAQGALPVVSIGGQR